MEDAAICEVDIGDGNALFAVFDGHGGTIAVIQAWKSASMWRKFSSLTLKTQNCTSREGILRPSLKPLGKWMRP